MQNFDSGRLKGRKLFVGTLMYDGRCTSTYTLGIAQLTALCTQIGIDLRCHFLSHEALITKARNIVADEFLRSGHDHLVFIDADIGFDARDVVHMLALQVLDERAPTYDVVAAPYALKRLSWQNVLKAAKTGMGDEDAARLARVSSNVAVHPADGNAFSIDAPVEVTKAGTGLMMIRRETLERVRDRHPWRAYGLGPDGPAIHAFFETEIDSKQGHIRNEITAFLTRFPEATADDVLAFLDSDATMAAYSGKHVSEDYVFCRRVREAGMKVWLCPWMELTHTGSHTFAGRLVDLAAIDAL